LEARHVITILLFGALFQIFWGYAQMSINHSLGLTFFGESVLGPDVLGVAKNDLANGLKQIRAYGSFLHPNIFAAYLLIVYFISLRYLKYGSKLFWFAVFIWGIYLTGSRAAMLAGFISLALYFLFSFFKAIPFRRSIGLITILILVIGNLWFFEKSDAINTRDASLKERLSQNMISKNMWKASPWGVGVSNFTLEMEKYSDCGDNRRDNSGDNCQVRKYMPWEFQPVHNVYFLILNETGIQGLLIFLMFLLALFDLYWKDGKAIPVFVLLMLAPFDHLLWDSWVGLMLVAFVAGFFATENRRENLVEKIEHAVHHE
jgi:O-antigen ligase